jgi:phage baseplate assembly protein W
MSYLLNRNPAARIECLHALVKFIYAKFGTYQSFSMKSVKFKREEKNIHEFCSLLIDSPLGTKYCPYKQNPLDDAGCSLTNGVDEDTTKSKEVSNTINALHALDFVKRDNNKIQLTTSGIAFAKAKYGSKDMQQIIKDAVLKYGPIIGVLKQICKTTKVGANFSSADIEVGYPNTSEIVKFKEYNVTLSSGSQKDSNTRTRSCLLAWLTAAGFIRPINLHPLENGEYAHSKYKDFVNRSHRGERTYVLVESIDFDNKKIITQKPLDYSNLTKLTAALRENNMSIVREATMQYETRINNRRFAIIYFLNESYKKGKLLSFDNLITFFHLHNDTFVITDDDLQSVIQNELSIADMAGIPFDIIESNGVLYLKPLAGINMDELSSTAPENLITILKNSHL